MGDVPVRLGNIWAGSKETMECLREQAIKGRLRDESCHEEGCQYTLFETDRAGESVRSAWKGDCLLQLRLRARALEVMVHHELDYM